MPLAPALGVHSPAVLGVPKTILVDQGEGPLPGGATKFFSLRPPLPETAPVVPEEGGSESNSLLGRGRGVNSLVGDM